jgi:tRNA1Val (adenine37-N6)-methyltransferase
VSNPPYYAEGRGKSSLKDGRASAREERTCTLADVCAAASYLTRWGGLFALVHKPERLAEVICALRENGLEPKRLRFVQYNAEAAPNLILIESRRGGKPSLRIEAPLILADEYGNDTEEVKRIYHRCDESRGTVSCFPVRRQIMSGILYLVATRSAIWATCEEGGGYSVGR